MLRFGLTTAGLVTSSKLINPFYGTEMQIEQSVRYRKILHTNDDDSSKGSEIGQSLESKFLSGNRRDENDSLRVNKTLTH